MVLKYLVGIDFGHGETTASCINVADGSLQHLRIKDADKEDLFKISSAVYKIPRKDKSYDYTLERKDGYGICISFKTTVDNLRKTSHLQDKEAFENFIRLVYKAIKDNNSFLEDNGSDSNFLIYIASPTKWSKREKAEYKEFVEKAIGRKIGWLINESDAAYYHKKEYGGLTLVVDFGSSTIDFTLMYNGKKIDIDDLSNRLGAERVENNLLEIYRNDKNSNYAEITRISSDNVRNTKNNNMSVYEETLFSMREQKETFYTKYKSLSNFYWDFEFNWIILGIDGVDPFRIRLKKKEEEILRDYMESVSSLFSEVKERIDKECKDRNIDVSQLRLILTGGASRMPWVRSSLLKVFGENTRLTKDDRPEYIVSDGIVNYAYALYQVRKEIAPIVNDLKDWLPELEDEMHQIISGVCQDICLKEIQQDKAIISYLSNEFQDDTVIDTDPRNSYYHNYYKSSIKGFVRIVDGINKRIYKNRKDINEEIFKRLNERIHEELDPMLRKSMLRLFHVEVSALNLLRGNQGILPLIQDNFTIGSDKLDEITDCCLERVGWCSWFNVNTLYGDESHEGTIRKDRGPNDRNRIARAYYDFIRETEFAPYSIGTIKDNIYNYVLDNIVSTVKDHLTFDPCGYDMKAEILSELERLRPFTARITSCEGKCVVVQRMEGMPKEEDTIEVEAEGLPALTALIKNVPSMNEWIRLTLDTEIPEAYLGGTVRKI